MRKTDKIRNFGRHFLLAIFVRCKPIGQSSKDFGLCGHVRALAMKISAWFIEKESLPAPRFKDTM
jgi:hypothetical protein